MDAIINEYKKHGVDAFYRIHGHDYENPHIDIVENLLKSAKEEWNINGDILDLCCGSGEVSHALEDCNGDFFREISRIKKERSTMVLYENRIFNV